MKKKGPVILTIFILAWSFIGISIAYFGWNDTWNKLFVPALDPPFGDMRLVQGAAISTRMGYDPRMENPGDPWGRIYNYPDIWIGLAEFLRLDYESNFLVFSSFCVIWFIASCFFLLKQAPSVYFLLATFSGASLLSVERANTDIIIFGLIFSGFLISFEYVRILILFAATALKIYPVFAIFGLIKKPILFVITILVIACVMAANFDELNFMQSATTAGGYYFSYGMGIMIGLLVDKLMTLNLPMDGMILNLAFLLFSAAAVMIIIKSKIRNLFRYSGSRFTRELFISGGAIYVCTFILSKNGDYRLIFLLVCIPFLLSIKNKTFMHATLFCVLISFNALFISHLGKPAIYAPILCKYFLFIIIGAFLAIELENYLYTLPFFPKRFIQNGRRDATKEEPSAGHTQSLFAPNAGSGQSLPMINQPGMGRVRHPQPVTCSPPGRIYDPVL